jgi:hypothetical protein
MPPRRASASNPTRSCCAWVGDDDDEYRKHHDEESQTPLRGDRALYKKFSLVGAWIEPRRRLAFDNQGPLLQKVMLVARSLERGAVIGMIVPVHAHIVR